LAAVFFTAACIFNSVATGHSAAPGARFFAVQAVIFLNRAEPPAGPEEPRKNPLLNRFIVVC
jgi:hypothetical protein